ncbi:DUF4123 domain-containing protein [Quatrionicoccus australiensis]|uniref:DUF4123 domain-containing protein n=1 Tax=Quatrionicoccus australiensis TaxID=138118 RepID=UPI001CFB0060|nr:DUF4123 domain-containing protein [Quatrionicoccus australiensis]MCB4359497.1 DUF4123 domain-containing protein [Quatrionicoccus australiensis]
MNIAAIEVRVAELNDLLHRELVSAQGRCWLLLDPVLRPVIDESPLGRLLVDSPLIRVPSAGDPDPSLMPLLVEFEPAKASDHDLIWQSLREALEELVPATLAQGGGRRICGWLESDVDGKTLARHIAAQMIQPHGEARRRLLRWHDPAVLWAIWPLLKAGQQTTLLGPITSFRLLNPVGQWVRLSPPQPATHQILDLENEQWRRIESIAALNGVLREFDLMSLSTAEIDNMRDNAMAALGRALYLGFIDSRDQRAFARLALTVHADFDAHPLVAERLAKRVKDDYFTALVDDLSAEHWARIRQDKTTSAPRQAPKQ